jgi:hypothetical protein
MKRLMQRAYWPNTAWMAGRKGGDVGHHDDDVAWLERTPPVGIEHA